MKKRVDSKFEKRLKKCRTGKSYEDIVKSFEDEEGLLHIIRNCLSYKTETIYDKEGNIINYSRQYNIQEVTDVLKEVLLDIEQADHIIRNLHTCTQMLQIQRDEQIINLLDVVRILVKKGQITSKQFSDAVIEAKNAKINQAPIISLEEYKISRRKDK